MARVTVALVFFATAASAKREVIDSSDRAPALSAAELAHKRHFFSIGEGFEGSASDWTEYVVWLLGVCGVFYYMANPNARRNLYAMQGDYPLNGPPPDDHTDDALDSTEDDDNNQGNDQGSDTRQPGRALKED